MFNVKIPPFVAEQKENIEIKKATDIEDKECKEFIQDIINQCFIDTATWGLKLWEDLYGIATDINKPIEFRRTVVKAKMRGQGTASIKMFKNMAESFSNGEVDIIENLEQDVLGIKFIGKLGIPPNLEDLEDRIRDNIPAHMVYKFIFTYLTWDEFDKNNKTWDEWDSLNLTWDEFETYRERTGDNKCQVNIKLKI